MFAHVITYDLTSSHPDGHSVFLKHLQAHGLSSWTEIGNEMVKLPNTTVSGRFASNEDAEAAFNAALRATRLELWLATITVTKMFIIPQGAGGLVLSNTREPKRSLAELFVKRPAPASALALAFLGQGRT